MFRIRLACTIQALDAVFALRRRALGARVDRFDAYPTTSNLAALVDNQVVGTVRVRDGSLDMLALETGAEEAPRLVVALLGMGCFRALSQGAAFEPREPFRSFAERQRIGHRLQAFERSFHGPGETVVAAGDDADAALVVVAGNAAAIACNGRVVDVYSRGETIGERDALCGLPHAYDVVAANELDLMVVERAALLRQARGKPAARAARRPEEGPPAAARGGGVAQPPSGGAASKKSATVTAPGSRTPRAASPT
jgi:hypothetical protein